MKSIVMVTGSYPPDVCGVGDYTKCLISVSDEKWKLFYKKSWKPVNFINYIIEINRKDPETIFLQYPTQGYGWSLLPHLLCVYFSFFTKVNFVLVLHEYSQLSFKARFALNIMLKTVNYVVFTNSFESQTVLSSCRRLKNKSSIIKIYSNIPVAQERIPIENRLYDVAYFGQIRPKKGIESFIFAVNAITKSNPQIKALLIGQVPSGFEIYFEQIKKMIISEKINIILNKSESEVAALLSNSKFVYLPFPDGCSERRGTFLAALKNGCVVITTNGKFTTDEMLKVALFTTPSEAPQLIMNLLNSNFSFQPIIASTKYFLENTIPSSWKEVLIKYEDINIKLSEKI